MLTPDQQKIVADVTRITQIIVFALAAGVTAYLVVAIAIRESQGDQTQLAVGGIAMAIGAGVVALLLPAYLAGQHRQAIAEGLDPATGQAANGDDAALLLRSWQVRKIIRSALLEGAAFMNIFVYQIGGPTYSLGIAIALLIAIAMQFPFRSLVEEWLDRELRAVNELRQLRR